MNPIATAALERARVRRGVRLESSDEEEADGPCMGSQTLARGALAARVRPLPPHHEALRVDLVMRIEGRREALGIVERSRLLNRAGRELASLHDQLERAAHGRPYSYAMGVLDIASLVHQLIDRSARREDSDAPRNDGRGNVARHNEVLNEQRTDS